MLTSLGRLSEKLKNTAPLENDPNLPAIRHFAIVLHPFWWAAGPWGLHLVAAQNRRSVLTATYKAATKWSAAACQLLFVLLLCASAQSAEPVKLHPENPKYFLFR